MHKTLQRQLKKVGLDEHSLPKDIDAWQAFINRVNTAYTQSDEGIYTIKRSSDIASREMETFNEKLSKLASFPEENVGPVLRISQKGKVEYSNTAGLMVLNHWGFSIGDTLSNHYLAAINEVFNTNSELTYEETINQTTFSLRFTPIIKSGYINIYGTDITRLKTIETNLVEARDQAEQANIAKSRFLANMSHELRTPMHGILGFVSLCIRHVDNEKVLGYLENIKTSATRLTGLLNNILDLAKLESGKMDIHFDYSDLTEISKHCVQELQPLCADKSLTITIDIQKSLYAHFDKTLITQVIINLLSNAIRFSPKHGLITLALQQKIFHLHHQEEPVLELIINDQGIGIPEKEMHTIFNKFIQSSKTATQAGGTGLGLSICEEIIQAHHGKIWAENIHAANTEQVSGASFHFVIPINQNTL